jgi:hypothetical protein
MLKAFKEYYSDYLIDRSLDSTSGQCGGTSNPNYTELTDRAMSIRLA